MLNLAEIGNEYVDEHICYELRKKFSTVYISENYVFKAFDLSSELYSEEAIQDEVEWDDKMPFINPVLIDVYRNKNEHIKVLVLKRLPTDSNLLWLLINDKIDITKLVFIGKKLESLFKTYPIVNCDSKTLYEGFIKNVEMQLVELHEIIPAAVKHTLINVLYDDGVYSVFQKILVSHNVNIVHGNMFAGNIYVLNNKMIVLDPISPKHISKKSFPFIDTAAYLTDMKFFCNSNYQYIHDCILTSRSDYELCMIHLYIMLKILVRIRFASYEYSGNLSNSVDDIHYTSYQENYIILSEGIDVLIDEIVDLKYYLSIIHS